MRDGQKAGERVMYTDFDDQYLAVDKHGMPGGYGKPRDDMYTDFDPAYKAVDKHGMPSGYGDPHAGTYTDFDDAYKAIDKHGMPGGYGNPGRTFHTEFDQEYLDVDRHGIPGGWANPDQEAFQTDDDKVIEFCKDIVDASHVTENGIEQLAKLSDIQVKKVIELRHMKTARRIAKRDTSGIEHQIFLDIAIIHRMVLCHKNLYDKDINISYLIGEEYTDILGVLDSYEQLLSNNRINGKETLLNLIEQIRENIKNIINEIDDGDRQK